MKNLILISVLLFNGCSLIKPEKEIKYINVCKKITYRLPLIKPVKIDVDEFGGLDMYNKNKAITLIKKLRKSEQYYYFNSVKRVLK